MRAPKAGSPDIQKRRITHPHTHTHPLVLTFSDLHLPLVPIPGLDASDGRPLFGEEGVKSLPSSLVGERDGEVVHIGEGGQLTLQQGNGREESVGAITNKDLVVCI